MTHDASDGRESGSRAESQGAAGDPRRLRSTGRAGRTAAKCPLLSFTPGGWRLEQDRYLPSAMTATPSLLSVRRCLMATYSGDSYQALAASLVANFSTTLTCPADPSSSSESRSTTIASAPWACKVGPTAARYFRYPAWSVIV